MFEYRLKDPQDSEAHRETEDKNALDGVTEMSNRRENQEVMKVGGHAAHHQRGKNQESAQGDDSSGMREGEGQTTMLTQVQGR